MERRTARGIALLVGVSFVAIGCSSSGGGAYVPGTVTSGDATGAGGASGAGGSAGSGGSGDAVDAGDAETGAAGGEGGDPSDAAREIDASAEGDARADAADVSIESDGAGPDVVGTPDVSVDTGRESSTDARPDVTIDARSEIDAPVDRGAQPDSPLSSGKSCVERCNADADCKPLLPTAEYECDLESHRCIVCRNDLACVAAASGWIVGCTQTSDCSFVGDVCVDVNGAGKCAFTKATCAGAFPDDIQAKELVTGATVTVCGVASSECHAGQCVDRCGAMHACTPEQGGRICNGSTGGCECASDNDCSAGVGVSKCNTVTKQCECAGNADCTGVDDVDVCVDGKCRCSSVNVCKRDFMGTTLTCE
jgi:hypothetical protein